VALTAFGELLLPHARTITAEVRQFDDSLAAMLGTRTGALRIGATPTPLSHLLPAAVKHLRSKRPKVKVAVEQGGFERLSGLLLQGQLDVVLSTEPPQPWDALLKIEQVGEDQNVVAIRAGHPLARARQIKPAMLNDYPWLAITNFPKAEADVRSMFSGSGLKPPLPAMTTSSVTFAAAWLAESDFICVLPRQLITRELADRRLVTLDLKLKPRRWPLVLATRGNATRTPATLAFIDAVKTVAAKGT
jgi:DNA-binding transcriptional LysR family regulator